MEEQRSFLPREDHQPEKPAVKIDPITSPRPTNRELGDGINQVHECFEAGKRDNAREFLKIKRDVQDIKDALGLGLNGKKPAGLSSQRGAFLRTLTATLASMGGVVIVWKGLAVLLPALAVAFEILNKAITSGKI